MTLADAAEVRIEGRPASWQVVTGALARIAAQRTLRAGALLFVLHVVVLAIWGSSELGSLGSNLIQLGLGILIVLSALGAARRSGSLGRQVWRLLTFNF